MARQITCECGYTVHGDNDEELLANAHEHIRMDHPDLVGQMTDEHLLGMAQDA
jgi:predicted small metal-binding protein